MLRYVAEKKKQNVYNVSLKMKIGNENHKVQIMFVGVLQESKIEITFLGNNKILIIIEKKIIWLTFEKVTL